MQVQKKHWTLLVALAVTSVSLASTGCRSVPSWGSMTGRSSESGSALASKATEAPRYGAPPSATSNPMPTSAQLAARRTVTPNYANSAPAGNAYAGANASMAAAGMQPQRGFYSQTPNGTPATPGLPGATAAPAGYAGYNAPPVNTYGGAAQAQPAAYTASANTNSSYATQASSFSGGNPASYSQMPTTGTSYRSANAPTAPAPSSFSNGNPASSGPSYPSTGGSNSYPSTGGSSSYPTTGASQAYPQSAYSGASNTSYPSTGSYSATAAPNPNDYQPTKSPAYQTASAQSHYRPGGTADYNSDATPPTTSRYGSAEGSSAYTR